MRRFIIGVTMLTSLACNSPLHPTPTGVTLTVQVMGHISNAPVQHLQLTLKPSGVWKRTDNDGKASWHVEPNQNYSIDVEGFASVSPSLVKADVQWLVSVPK